jgi:uncharacterized protein YndB with AHSA1/START domain
MQATKITVATTIAADIEKVWDYYTKPEHITRWNFADESWHCPASENDLRVGGKLKSRMEAKDGSFGFDFEAIYDEVIDQKRITYTIADGRQAITDFVALDGKTQVTINFDAESENPAEMQQAGWQAILNNFKKYTETH